MCSRRAQKLKRLSQHLASYSPKTHLERVAMRHGSNQSVESVMKGDINAYKIRSSHFQSNSSIQMLCSPKEAASSTANLLTDLQSESSRNLFKRPNSNVRSKNLFSPSKLSLFENERPTKVSRLGARPTTSKQIRHRNAVGAEETAREMPSAETFSANSINLMLQRTRRRPAKNVQSHDKIRKAHDEK